MTSFQAGQRALSLSASVIMASTTFIKDAGCAGILRLLLLGILLPSVLVSGQTSSPSNATVPSNSSTNSTTSVVTDNSTTMQSFMMITDSMASTAATAQSASPTVPEGETAMTRSTGMTGSTAMTSSTGVTGSTAMTSSTGVTSSTAMTGSSGPMTASGSTMSSSSMTSGPSSSASMMSTSMSYSTEGTTMPYSTSMSMIYCPSFMCNYSDCYAMYNSQNATKCSAGARCELIRKTDMCYTVSCSASCADRCLNDSQTNCSVNCCNSTGCLNSTFASMMMTTTTVETTTIKIATTPVTTTAATSAQTTANNGNKCSNGTCTGETCYTEFSKAVQTCSSSQPHCQLKKETVNSNLQWTAGCTTNCSGKTSCKASTQPPCHLECCNATTTSCLWLNGTLNVSSFATRGPNLNTELIASLLCLLAITLLL